MPQTPHGSVLQAFAHVKCKSKHATELKLALHTYCPSTASPMKLLASTNTVLSLTGKLRSC